ncbi:MAG: FKBP-type peptidyl-prolyl cis-trans isomerase [Bacteroidota bacterium]
MNISEMLRKLYQFALCLMILGLASCDDQFDCNERPDLSVDQEKLENEIAEIENYLEGEGIDYETDPSGIRYSVIESGTGNPPNFCSSVMVDYTGKILGGSENFGSAIGAQFSLRNNEVVPGFKLALHNMNRNAEYRVYVPASLLIVRGISQTLPANLPLDENVEFRIRLNNY